MKKLPNRVFRSPLLRYANFSDGSFINLIRLVKPYANGDSYAIYIHSTNPNFKSRLFKNCNDANNIFNKMVCGIESEIIKIGVTNN